MLRPRAHRSLDTCGCERSLWVLCLNAAAEIAAAARQPGARAWNLAAPSSKTPLPKPSACATSRLIVTAADEYWLDAACAKFTGYSSSVIACDAETGVERRLPPDETPDGRPGAAVLVFGFSTEALAKSVPNRVGQCLMTCPTTAVYDGLPDGRDEDSAGQERSASSATAFKRASRSPAAATGEFR